MCEQRNVHINLPALLDIVGLGVRRASSFMALGIRMSEDQAVTNVTLDTNHQILFMRADLPIEAVRDVQRNFAKWIVGNGLRELDQAMSIFADRAFEVCTLARFHNDRIDQASIDGIRDFKKRTNVANKLRTIAEDFEIDIPLREHMEGLSKARNALSHNMGIVDAHHTTHDCQLRLSWIGQELVVGDRVVAGTFEPFNIQGGELIQYRIPVRNRIIPMGAPVELTPHELSEICFTYWELARRIIPEIEGHLRASGIPINGGQAA